MTRPPSRAAARLLALLEVPALAAVPLVLGVCAYFQVEQGALLTVVVAFAAVGVFFASFEASPPALRQIMPTVVLAALAAASPEALYDLKERDRGKPVSWLVGGVDDLDRYGAHVPDLARRLARAYWPGHLTLIVEACDAVPAGISS